MGLRRDSWYRWVQGRLLGLSRLAAEMSRQGVHLIDLRSAEVLSDLYCITNDQFVVVRCNAAGCVVKNGSIAWPENAAFLIEGHGSHFSDISFTGAVALFQLLFV